MSLIKLWENPMLFIDQKLEAAIGEMLPPPPSYQKIIDDLEYAVLSASVEPTQQNLDRVARTKSVLEGVLGVLEEDARRLTWAMHNMSRHNYILFGMHVVNAGGTGDIFDCRSFVDKAMRGEE